MFCHKCGAKAIEGAEFCQKCGAKLIIDTPDTQSVTESSTKSTYQSSNISTGIPQAIVAFLESTGFEDALRNQYPSAGTVTRLPLLPGA